MEEKRQGRRKSSIPTVRASPPLSVCCPHHVCSHLVLTTHPHSGCQHPCILKRNPQGGVTILGPSVSQPRQHHSQVEAPDSLATSTQGNTHKGAGDQQSLKMSWSLSDLQKISEKPAGLPVLLWLKAESRGHSLRKQKESDHGSCPPSRTNN